MSDQPATIELRTREVGPWPMNTYVLVCPHTRASVLIDPGAEVETLQVLLAGTTPVAILLTHTHPDHIGALEPMRRLLNVPLMAHTGPHYNDMSLSLDRTLADRDTVPVGQHTLRAYQTPGHIPDMLCYAIEGDNRVIVGDTIFAGGPGHTNSAADFQTTLGTLRNVVLAWPDETLCYPGHGPAFYLGGLRPAIEAFLSRDHGDFFGDATWDL